MISAPSHDELVADLVNVEKMPLSDRLKLAKKRRAQQLKSYYHREKQLTRQSSSNNDKNHKSMTSSSGADVIKPTGNSLLNGFIASGSEAASALRRKLTTSTSTVTSNNRVSSDRRASRLRFSDSVLLIDATIRNDLAEVRRLLDQGISADTCTEDGLTALHQCSIDNLEEMSRLLVESGASVNSRDSEQWSPLHAAATCGHVRICKYLCERGADLLAVNSDGNMPYDLCEDGPTLDYIESEMARRGITQQIIDETRAQQENAMLQDLKRFSADAILGLRGASGETPRYSSSYFTNFIEAKLHVAACCGYLTVAEYLVSRGLVAIDVKDNDEWRPIHCAACWGQLALIELLVDLGADVDAKTRNGETLLDLCEDIEMKQRIIVLMDHAHNRRARSVTRVHVPSSRRQSLSRRSAEVREDGAAETGNKDSYSDKTKIPTHPQNLSEGVIEAKMGSEL